MSASANLVLVSAIFAEWERGDFSSAAWADPEVEFVFADGPSPGTWMGSAGMAEGFRGFVSTWEQYCIEAEQYNELDGERVLVLVHLRGRGKISGLELGQMRSKGANLFHLRGGKVTRLILYLEDRERALVELGLAPGTGT